MTAGSCAIVGFGALSALGEGTSALGVGRPGELAPSRVVRDPELERAGLRRPFCARVQNLEESRAAATTDRATRLFERALTCCAAELDRVLPDWRTRRVGLAIGTSSGGMRSFEAAFGDAGKLLRNGRATYLGPVLEASRPHDFSPFALVLGACASGTLAIGLAREWLRTNECDVALCGGFDAVSVFVASGFEALRATSAEAPPRPFRRGRDGLALGEGAAVLALVRQDDAPAGSVLGHVVGFGATCDAVHLTAPDREGRGLARAAACAIASLEANRIDLISAHGTATEFNDAAEAHALAAVLGARAARVPLHALKAGTGHTLGAAGALETLAAALAMRRAVAPASAGTGEMEGGVCVLSHATASEAVTALKLSAAFGGANGALVVARDPSVGPSAIARRPVYVSRAVAVIGADATLTDLSALAAATGYPEERLLRADGLVRLGMTALVRLTKALVAEGREGLRGAGIIVGHGLATLDTNAKYHARIVASGARAGEPRRFPYTSPNACAGECAVAFGLTGPAFAVGGGSHGGIEALAVAASLVRGGVAERIVVLAVDEAGEGTLRMAPETVAGAVALLVSAEPHAARLEECSVTLPAHAPHGLELAPAVEAHRALLPLATGRPDILSAAGAFGDRERGFATARFLWL